MNLLIRPANIADAHVACTVLRRSITECCVPDHHNNPEILDAWLKNKTPENIANWFTSPMNYAVVAIVDKAVVGVGLIANWGEVMLCYVLPETRFTGAGKALLRIMEEHAVSIGLGEIFLNSTNTAREFYLRNGFEHNGEAEVKHGVTSWPMRKKIGS